MRLLSSHEMQQVEQYTAKYGLSYQRMMENAGAACTRNIRNVMEGKVSQKKTVAVVCGKGNNGGDGFVIARKFCENGYNVSVILACGYPQSQEAVYMYKLVVDLAIPTIWYDADPFKATQAIKNADIIVDAVFGFGFFGTVAPELAGLFREMSQAPGTSFSVDVPSGVYCDSGLCADGCMCADYTIAISALKPAHVMHPGSEFCGDIIVAGIGIPEESYAFLQSSMYTYSFAEVKNLFPKRTQTGNKGDFGHVLCLCGSRKMPGAAVLSVSGALRSGAGLVTAAFPQEAYAAITSHLVECLMLPLEANMEGTFSVSSLPEVEKAMQKADCILIGCGLGLNGDTKELVSFVLRNAQCPVVADADALNVIAQDKSLLDHVGVPLVLTPHPGEMARLCDRMVEEVQQDRLNVAGLFCRQYPITLVLKGANTLVCSHDEPAFFVNSTGNSGMSKGGCGDLLAGLIAGFIAQGMPIKDACSAGVYIHGYVGETVSDELSQRGMLPSDMATALPGVLKSFEG